MQVVVEGLEDDAETAAAEDFLDLVMSQSAERAGPLRRPQEVEDEFLVVVGRLGPHGGLFGDGRRGGVGPLVAGRPAQEIAGPDVGVQQRLDLAAQLRVAGAGPVQKRASLGRRGDLQGLLEDRSHASGLLFHGLNLREGRRPSYPCDGGAGSVPKKGSGVRGQGSEVRSQRPVFIDS